MNSMKNIFQHSNIVARICTSKKTSQVYVQSRSMYEHKVVEKEKKAFHNVMSDVANSIAAYPGIAAIPELQSWTKKLFTYNITGGKVERGLSTVTAYEMLEKPENITEETMKLARVLGWCVEMFHTYLVIMDDMMDGSSRRRGQPCWHLLQEVGTSCAMNDSVLVYNGMLYAVRKHFQDRENYREMLDTINETLLCCAIGQHLDIKTSNLNKDFSKFTPERHLTITEYKTGYYTYDLPIYLGFLLTGNKLDVKTRKQVQDLSVELGNMFQMQDDYIDCYSDNSITGKSGNDIQEGKCTWLAVSALQRCNASQRVVFSACYGSKEPAHIERIKRLYYELKLPELYKEVEKQFYDRILDKIRDLPSEEWKRLFYKMLGVTYQRKK